MRKKSLPYFDAEYLLIAVLLLFSGDPITRFMSKYTMLAMSVVIFISMYNKIKKDFYTFFFSIAAALLVLFLSQYAVLGFVSWLGALNYINSFFLGGLVVYLLADRFAHKFFIAMYYISLISLICFVFINILNIKVPGFVWGIERITYGIYTFVEQHHYRNCGMFWEPGAFAGVLTLCLALNAKQLQFLLKKHAFKLVVITLALISTQSTTGYIVFFLILSYILFFFVKDKTIAFTLLPVLLIISVVVYSNADFLQEKVKYQSESSLTLDQGEFSNTRFGSFIFDMHYVKKHPIVGNGFHESTRYADNPELIQLIQMGENLGNGNGFSNYMACLGIPFMFLYLLLSFKAISKIDQKVAILTTIVILLTLFSEQWLSYSLFLGIVFLNYNKNKMNEKKYYGNTNYLPQPQI